MTMTPWGPSQRAEQVADGVTHHMTASHGGFKVEPRRLDEIPAPWREFAARWSHGWGDAWYEEDCAADAIIASFGTEMDDTDILDALVAADRMAHHLTDY